VELTCKGGEGRKGKVGKRSKEKGWGNREQSKRRGIRKLVQF